MPADPWLDALRMLWCLGAVAAVVLPVGLVAHLIARRVRPSDPPTDPWHAPWGPFEVVAAFILLNIVLPVLLLEVLTKGGFYHAVYGDALTPDPADPAATREATTVRLLWATAFALPFQLGLVVLVRNNLFPRWSLLDPPRDWPRRVAQAAVAWAALTPMVLVVHAAVNLAFDALGWRPQTHPLTKLGVRPVLDRVLFVFQACVTAPLMEELVFRGILLPWLLVDRRRALPVLGVGVLLALSSAMSEGGGVLTRGSVIFAAGLLAVGGVWVAAGKGGETWPAIFASAGLFGMVHANVWPSPIPLFVLGVGLGWLAVRTRGVLVPTLVHGLFNGVSVLLVLRSAA